MQTETTYPVLEGLMDAAYETFGDQTYAAFLSNLPAQQRKAVLIGNLNYQVENGGFGQWILNRYADYARDVMLVLREIGTDAAIATESLIMSARSAYRRDGDDANLDAQDTAFYSLNEQLLADAEAFFS